MTSHSQTIYFAGICGTAMASLAVLLKKRGHVVLGSDQNVYPPMSTFLEDHDISVLPGYSSKNLETAPDLVVIGNALSRGNPEVEAVLNEGIPYISMAELLKRFFLEGKTPLVVTGTHGKTTTTSLLASLFRYAQQDPSFLIGGIVNGLGSSCYEGQGSHFILEGDEYDTAFFDKRSKFFHYLPQQLVLNNIEYDHADIFDSLQDILKSFKYLLRLVPQKGLIVANGDDANVKQVLEHAHSPVRTFGVGSTCDVQIKNLHSSSVGTCFELYWKQTQEAHVFESPLLGEHNARNATAAILLGRHNGLSVETLSEGLKQFGGVKRRLELRGVAREVSVYDDFAHHPTAIQQTLNAFQQQHPNNRIIAVFEPRSNTSVQNIHQKELIDAFSHTPYVVLCTPHRQDRIPQEKRLDVDSVVQALKHQGKQAYAFSNATQILTHLSQNAQAGDHIVIMSNGGFENIHERLLEQLQS